MKFPEDLLDKIGDRIEGDIVQEQICLRCGKRTTGKPYDMVSNCLECGGYQAVRYIMPEEE